MRCKAPIVKKQLLHALQRHLWLLSECIHINTLAPTPGPPQDASAPVSPRQPQPRHCSLPPRLHVSFCKAHHIVAVVLQSCSRLPLRCHSLVLVCRQTHLSNGQSDTLPGGTVGTYKHMCNFFLLATRERSRAPKEAPGRPLYSCWRQLDSWRVRINAWSGPLSFRYPRSCIARRAFTLAFADETCCRWDWLASHFTKHAVCTALSSPYICRSSLGADEAHLSARCGGISSVSVSPPRAH